MNLFMCLPELVVSLVISPLVGALGGSLRLPMVVSAVACLAATGVIFFGFAEGWRGKWCARAEAADDVEAPASSSRGEPAALRTELAAHDERICALEAMVEALQARLDEKDARGDARGGVAEAVDASASPPAQDTRERDKS